MSASASWSCASSFRERQFPETEHKVKLLGVAANVRERLYAVTVERRIKHPAVVAISEAARTVVFGTEEGISRSSPGSGTARRASRRQFL